MVSDTLTKAGLRIQTAHLQDVHNLRKLEQAIFKDDAYSYLNLSTVLMWPGSVNLKLVDHGGGIIGFVACQPNFLTHTDWIITICVAEAHQGHGLGRRLLQEAEDRTTQSILRLTVRPSNNVAIGLYSHMGYSSVYMEPRYYNDGEDGMVMEKKRSGPGYEG